MIKDDTKNHSVFKGGLLLKNQQQHICLYFIDTKLLYNNALVDYIDN